MDYMKYILKSIIDILIKTDLSYINHTQELTNFLSITPFVLIIVFSIFLYYGKYIIKFKLRHKAIEYNMNTLGLWLNWLQRGINIIFNVLLGLLLSLPAVYGDSRNIINLLYLISLAVFSIGMYRTINWTIFVLNMTVGLPSLKRFNSTTIVSSLVPLLFFMSWQSSLFIFIVLTLITVIVGSFLSWRDIKIFNKRTGRDKK